MSNTRQHDPIQGQDHIGLKVVKMADFKVDMHVIKKLIVNYGTPRQYLNFNWTDFDTQPRSASYDLQT